MIRVILLFALKFDEAGLVHNLFCKILTYKTSDLKNFSKNISKKSNIHGLSTEKSFIIVSNIDSTILTLVLKKKVEFGHCTQFLTPQILVIIFQ